MSDPFDPEAWPRSSGASSPRPEEEDDFNPFASPAGPQDDDDYDASTFGAGSPVYGEEDPYGQGGAGEPGYGSTAGNDFGTGYDDADQDDYDYAETAAAPRAAGRGEGDYRDEFDDYDDFDDYDNENDNYDEFDNDDRYNPEGGDEGNGRRVLIVAALVVVAGLLGGGLLFAASGNKDKNNVAGDQTQTTTSKPKTTATTKDTTQTTAGAATGTGTAKPAPADVVKGLNDALTAWGRFAVNGKLDEVKPHFVNDSNQYNRFKLDAATIAAQPPGGAAITVSMPNPQTYYIDDNNWLMHGKVTWVRAGEQTQEFPWEIRLTRQSDRQTWQVQSVRQY